MDRYSGILSIEEPQQPNEEPHQPNLNLFVQVFDGDDIVWKVSRNYQMQLHNN